jgi:hypothetical protein
MLTFRCATSSTGSGINTSARSAVAPRAVLAGGVAVVGPDPAAAAADMLNRRTLTCCCNANETGAARPRAPRSDMGWNSIREER